MSKVNPAQTTIAIENFIGTIFSHDPKNILIWDTCSLLDILRLPYRNGDINTFKILNEINELVQQGEIYSICSALTINEWDEHQEVIKNDTQVSLEKTSIYHRNCIDITNEIYTSVYESVPLYDKNLVNTFELIADQIIEKTIFLDTESVANDALQRIALKRPPGSKKQEFKDCTIWETSISVAKLVAVLGVPNRTIFYTVNTADFADKSREPILFQNILISEAVVANLDCCLKLDDVRSILIPNPN